MSTQEYLDTLDRDQLKYAIDYAQKRIQAIQSEPSVRLWVVSEGMLNHAAYELSHH